MKEKGILQPILVRPIAGDRNAFEIVAGERRWRAAQLAKLHDVPVMVREMSDGEALELAIIENVQRAGSQRHRRSRRLSRADGPLRLYPGQSRLEVGKSRSHVANTLRLLKLPETVKTMVRDGQLTAGHARTLIGVPDPEARAREILAGALNVRQSEQRSQTKKAKIHKQAVEDPNIKDVESMLSNALGLKVQVLHRGIKAAKCGFPIAPWNSSMRSHGVLRTVDNYPI